MARNTSISSLIANINTNKTTFKSYINLDTNTGGESPHNTDDMWTTLDENGVKDLNRIRRNSSLTFGTRDHKSIERRTSSVLTLYNDTIDGVNYFYSHTRHRTGICGQLSLISNGLKFSSYTLEPIEEKSIQLKTTNHSLNQFIPFFSEKSGNFEIDLLSIDEIKDSFDSNFISITILCSNFRCLRFQTKSCDQTKRFVDKLRRMTANRFETKYSKLTNSLKDNYRYVLKADWNRFESHWKECYKLRITQSNEGFHLSDSLPQSFVVPNTITDQMLIALISTQTRGHRVPVVSYLYPQNGNLLIRSSAFDNYEDLNGLLKEMVTPLRQINVDSILPSLLVVEQSYDKIKEISFQTNLNEDSSGCLNKIGKWINCVNNTLKLVEKVIRIITNEASVGLVEELDREWNCVVSSLVQLVIDPNRRTMTGFESLVSKEWVYISGLANRKSGSLNSNHILFTLFLDCVFQLIIQNPFAFEFTSFYLIYLFDCQYKQISIPFLSNVRRNTKMNCELEVICPSIRNGLPLNHLMLITNPFHKKNIRNALTMKTHISQMEFWSALYLRWQSKPILEHLSDFEIIYLNELQSRNEL